MQRLVPCQLPIERVKLPLDGATVETLASFESMNSTIAAEAEVVSATERPIGYTVANEALLIAAFCEASSPGELAGRDHRAVKAPTSDAGFTALPWAAKAKASCRW